MNLEAGSLEILNGDLERRKYAGHLIWLCVRADSFNASNSVEPEAIFDG